MHVIKKVYCSVTNSVSFVKIGLVNPKSYYRLYQLALTEVDENTIVLLKLRDASGKTITVDTFSSL